MLQPYFASASLFPAPAATGTSGGRTTAVTTDGVYVSSINGRSGVVNIGTLDGQVMVAALVGGLYTWTYPQSFNSTPAVFAFPIGNSPSAGLFAQAVSNVSAIIQSTNGSDTRSIMMIAVGNPN